MLGKTSLYQFIKDHYRGERFEGRNTKDWGVNYSTNIVNSYMEDLEQHGVAFISVHESVTGKQIMFDRELNILEGR